MRNIRLFVVFGLLAMVLPACEQARISAEAISKPGAQENLLASPATFTAPANLPPEGDEPSGEPAALPENPVLNLPTAIPTVEKHVPTPAAVGPETHPVGINPLTGLAVENVENLAIPPALVSIANWPPQTRPQAGLSFSPLVFELYIGEGMTRFLSLFYGDFPKEAVQNASPMPSSGGSPMPSSGGSPMPSSGGSPMPSSGGSPMPSSGGSPMVTSADAEIGPIRSGRLPYESLRKIYNGFLVMASAYKGVAVNLDQYTNIYGSDAGDVNSAMISVTRLADIARSTKARIGNAELTGMAFDYGLPAGGADARRLWFFVSHLDQILWSYDPRSGAYLRSQDNADGKTFIQATDRLTGEPLTFENVIVLFANHRYCTETAFDLDLMYIDKGKALAFRDGKMYPISWTTKNTEYERTTGKVRPIRFLDASGSPYPLKPGQTWVHIVPLNTPYWETGDTMDLYRLLNNKEPGSGNWAMRFYTENMEFDSAVCDQIRSQ